ncbi:hypothetical protein J2S52_003406 [Streptomyces sp. DSM 41037]|nr:hypothetical protein [Streptomyces sp. DSM 41037]
MPGGRTSCPQTGIACSEGGELNAPRQHGRCRAVTRKPTGPACAVLRSALRRRDLGAGPRGGRIATAAPPWRRPPVRRRGDRHAGPLAQADAAATATRPGTTTDGDSQRRFAEVRDWRRFRAKDGGRRPGCPPRPPSPGAASGRMRAGRPTRPVPVPLRPSVRRRPRRRVAPGRKRSSRRGGGRRRAGRGGALSVGCSACRRCHRAGTTRPLRPGVSAEGTGSTTYGEGLKRGMDAGVRERVTASPEWEPEPYVTFGRTPVRRRPGSGAGFAGPPPAGGPAQW